MVVAVGNTAAVAGATGNKVSALTTAEHLGSTTVAVAVALAPVVANCAQGAGAGAVAVRPPAPTAPAPGTGAAPATAAAAAAAACLAWATFSSRSCRNGSGRSSGVQMRQVLGIGQRTRWLRRLLQGRHHRCSHGSPLGACLDTCGSGEGGRENLCDTAHPPSSKLEREYVGERDQTTSLFETSSLI